MKFPSPLCGLAVLFSLGASLHGNEAANSGRIAEVQRAFTSRDLNSDGFLTLQEYKTSSLGRRDPARAEERFHLQDINKDQKLTLEEFAVHPSKREVSSK